MIGMAALVIAPVSSWAASTTVVISQVYGRGGAAGAPFLNDFIELHNISCSAVSVAGWSVQYAGVADASWSKTLLTGTIPAGGYYLVQGNAGTGPAPALPTPDATGTINLAAAAGKVALVNTTTTIANGVVCPSGVTIVDIVGYGTTADCSEGSPAPVNALATSQQRKSNGCTDTDNNAADFVVSAVNPRNSASTPVTCGPTPTISCPGNITRNTDANACTAANVTWSAPTATGTPAPAVSCSPASGSTFNKGTSTVTCTAVNGCGAVSCSFTVTVTDSQPPVLSLPANLTAECTGSGGATVTFTATATDACDGALSVTCNPSSGSSFPVGTTTVACSAADTVPNSASGSFTVTVVDTTKPVLTMPADITGVQCTGNGGAVVTFTVTATDACEGTVTPVCNPHSGESFSVGTTTVTCSAQDSRQNKTVASFTVTVVDTTPPTLALCPADQTVTATSAAGAVVSYTLPTATDACDSTAPAVTCSPASGSTFAIGATPVACTATDAANNSGSCTFTVTVRPPAAEQWFANDNLPPDNSHYVSPGDFLYITPQGVGFRNVSHGGFTQHFPPPAPGATETHSFGSVVVMDLSMDGGASFSRVSAPAQVTVALSDVSLPGATTRTFDTEMLSLSLAGGSLPGGMMIRESPTKQSLGKHTVRAAGGGGGGSSRIGSFFDIFTEISLDGGQTWSPFPSNVHLELERTSPEDLFATGNLPPLDGEYVSPPDFQVAYENGVVLFEAVHGKFTQSQPPPPPGGTQVQQCDSQVTVTLVPARPVTAPAQVTVRVTSRQTDAGGTRYFDTEMLQLDISGGGLPAGAMIRESPTKQSLGKTTVRSAGGGGGGSRISSFFDIFTEISLDGGQNWSPALDAVRMELALAPATSAPVIITDPQSVSAECGSDATFTVSAAGGAPLGYQWRKGGSPLSDVPGHISGSTTPTLTITHASVADADSYDVVVSNAGGSTTSAAATLTVVDTTPPAIACGQNQNVEYGQPWQFTVPVVSDVCDGNNVTLAIVSNTADAGSCAHNVTFTRVWRATDSHNNSSDCAQIVTVSDRTPPMVSCPGDFTVTATSQAGALVTYGVLTSDPGGDAVALNCTPLSNTIFPVGTHTVNCTATDVCGNSAACSFVVTVNNTGRPRLQTLVDAAAAGSTVHVPAGEYDCAVIGKNLTLVADGLVVVHGCSPALTVTAGIVSVSGFTFVTATADPTILVTGGSLKVRTCVVQESSAASAQPAVRVTGIGLVDLGTSGDLGGNTININGVGSLIRNEGVNAIAALGNAWKLGGVVIGSSFDIEDSIYHALDASGVGLVTYVAGSDFVTPDSGSIQRGINAVASGGRVNVKTGIYIDSPDATGTSIVLVPGSSPGQVVIIGDLTLDANDTLELELNGTTAGTGYDQLVVDGDVTLGGATLSATAGFTYAGCDTLTLIQNDGVNAVTGTFAGLPNGATVTISLQGFKIFYDRGDGNDVVLIQDTTPPALTACPSSVVVPDLGPPGEIVNYTAPTATDNCAPAPTVVCSPASGSPFPPGATTVTCTATDGVGLTATCSFVVVVCGANPAITYVDDNYTGLPIGTLVQFPAGGGGPNHIIGCDAFAAIQDGVNAVAVGGAVNVAAGVYAGNVVVPKALALRGANAGVDARSTCSASGPRGPESIIDGLGVQTAIVIQSSGVTLDGFTIQGGCCDGNNSGIYMPGFNDNRVLNNIIANNSIGIFPNPVGPLPTLIERNRFDSNNNPTGPSAGAGIYVDFSVKLVIDQNEFKGHTVNNPLLIAATGAGSHTDLVVSGNNFHVDNTAGSAIYALGITGGTFSKNQIASPFSGIRLGGANSSVEVSNNFFTAATVGVRVVDDGYGFGDNSSIGIHGNSFSGMTAFAVAYEGGYSTSPLDASANWWGVNTLVGVIAAIDISGGPVDFTPWLDTGIEPVADVCNGFQGDFATLHVDDASPQYGAVGRIQEAINLVTGSTVLIGPGTYVENDVIGPALAVTLIGSGSGANPAVDSIITAANAALPEIEILNIGGSSSANRLEIRNLRLQGGADGLRVRSTSGSHRFYRFDNVVANGHPGSGIRFTGTASLGDAVVSNSSANNNGLYGVFVEDTLANFDTLLVTGCSFANNDQNGLFAFGAHGNPASPSGVQVVSSTFTSNGNPGNGGSGAINFFLYNGDAGLKDVSIISDRRGPIQFRGKNPPLGLASCGIVGLTNVTVTGTGLRPALYIQQYADVNNVTFNNVDLSAFIPTGFLTQMAVEHFGATPLNLGKLKLKTTYLGGPPSGYVALAMFASGGAVASCETVIVNAVDTQDLEDAVIDKQDNPALGDVVFPAFSIACAAVTPPPAECTGPGGTVVTYATPAVTADCTPLLATVSCAPASGSSFALGITPVTCTATDNRGITTTCSFNVTVVDTVPPVISGCPGPVITVMTGPGRLTCDQVVTWAAPTALDTCAGTVSVVCTPASGSTFTVGTTPVDCTATDGINPVQHCNFTVTVVDNTPPTIACAGSVVVNADPGLCSASVVSLGTPMTADNCGVFNVMNNAPGSFPVGSTPVTWTVTDIHGITATCVQTVTVIDNQNPTIACPAGPIELEADVNCVAVVASASAFGVTAIDNCSAVITYTTNGMPVIFPASFPLGTIAVVATATDPAGLTATCNFTVKVIDLRGDLAANEPCWRGLPNSTFQHWAFSTGIQNNIAPERVSGSPGSPLANVTLGALGIGYTDIPPSVLGCVQGIWDLGSGGTIDLTIPNSAGSPTSYKYVRVQVTALLNAPFIELPDVSIASLSGAGVQVGSAVVTVLQDVTPFGKWVVQQTIWRIPAPCPATETVTLTSPLIGNSVVDQVVVDTICVDYATVCPPSQIVSADPGLCTAVVTYTSPAVDNCLIDAVTCLPASGSAFAVGVNTVTCTITDAENQTTTCAFGVTVIDTQPPLAQCQNITVALSPLGTVTITGADVDGGSTDNCAILSRVVSPSSFTCANVGANPVVLTVTDVNGLTATCNATVTVQDVTPPAIACPLNVTVNADVGQCFATGVVLGLPTVTDACGVATTVNNAPSQFPIGATMVTWTATDVNGNVNICQQTVTVLDTQAPVIGAITATQPQPVTLVNVLNCANDTLQGIVSISVVVTDNCPLATPPTISLVNGVNTGSAVFVNQSPAGTFNYTWTVAPATANGTWTATVAATDGSNPVSTTFTLCVNKSQITGQVQLQNFGLATLPLITTRTVVFVATDIGGVPLKTWTLPLTFPGILGGDTAGYTLTGVPANTARLSAKTAWHKRRRLDVTFDINNQAVANFTGTAPVTGKQLLGGDITGDNIVNFADYLVLATHFSQPVSGPLDPHDVANITGDGAVNVLDYSTLASNWFTVGDPQ